MGRPCSICEHPRVEAIERDLRGGKADRAVARRFDTNATSIRRHRTTHMVEGVALPPEGSVVDRVEALLDVISARVEAAARVRVLAAF